MIEHKTVSDKSRQKQLPAEKEKREDAWSRFQQNTNDDYLSRQNIYESNARSYPRRIPISIKKAEGIYVTDVNGKEYIDCLAGAGALALGHNHPVVINAIQECIDDKSALLTLDITTPIKDKFVKTFFDILPTQFKKEAKIQFCSPSGADAVEAAIKLSKISTKRSAVFAFSGSYHGMTNGALSLTGNRNAKSQIPNLMKDVHFMPFPYHYRCPFGIGGVEAERISLHYIENLLKDSHSGINLPAAFILEVVQGEGGTIPASPFWIRGIREITQKYNIPLIIDEVQTGIGRTGRMFSFEESGIIPDIIIVSKAIGGSLPLSFIVYRDYLDQWTSGAHAGTFRGNQMAMKTGTAVLEYIQENGLIENAQSKGAYLLAEFLTLKKAFPFIGEVRVKGLMIGVEIVDVKQKQDSLGSYPLNPEMAIKIQKLCLDKGLIVEIGGRHSSILRLLPPLILNQSQAEKIIEIFRIVLTHCYR